ncbi:MAG TPA: hypothetical protein VMT99_01410 [Candidatus Paceibacterota bacterium]|nr:hypothetical protein [Candidatus Paceibacterota bacterium]
MFRRVAVSLICAIFVGLPVGLAVINLADFPFSASLVFVLAFTILGGTGGYFLAKKLEASISKESEKVLGDTGLQAERERRLEMAVRIIYSLIIIAVAYHFAFAFYSTPSLLSVIFLSILAVVFLIRFITYDTKKSLWTKRMYLALFAAFAVYLAAGAISFLIVSRVYPSAGPSALLDLPNQAAVYSTPSVSTTTRSATLSVGANKSLTFTATLPPGYEMTYDASNTWIQIDDASSTAGIFINALAAGNFSDALNEDRQDILAVAQGGTTSQGQPVGGDVPLKDTSTTFLTYPAHILTATTLPQNEYVVFQVGSSAIHVGVDFSTSTGANQRLEQVLNSLRISQ